MDNPTLLHNPRCSKSRAALQLLQEAGATFEERRYLERPLTFVELQELQRALARPPRDWCRVRESAYAEAGLSDESSDEDILRAMERHPILIERPILLRAGKAAVGRPPENILDLMK